MRNLLSSETTVSVGIAPRNAMGLCLVRIEKPVVSEDNRFRARVSSPEGGRKRCRAIFSGGRASLVSIGPDLERNSAYSEKFRFTGGRAWVIFRLVRNRSEVSCN